MSLADDVAAAVERLAQPGIDSWGLWPSNALIATGDYALITTSRSTGCTSETCGHSSHSPAAPNRRLVARRGRLVRLGGQRDKYDGYDAYYAHVADAGDVIRYIAFEADAHHTASVYIARPDRIPDWVLARLAREES